MTACSNMISPDSFRQIAQPSLIKIFKNIPSPHILHMCGHTNHIIADMEHCGADALSVETRNNLQLSRQAIGKEPLLFGHVDVAELMTQGTTVEVEQAVLESMAGGVDSIWPSCDVWPAAKPENMRAMVETVRKYGAQKWMRKS